MQYYSVHHKESSTYMEIGFTISAIILKRGSEDPFGTPNIPSFGDAVVEGRTRKLGA